MARGVGDGEIGLAGAGRADAEDQLGAVHGADIGVLRRRAGRDRPLARGDLARGAPRPSSRASGAQLRSSASAMRIAPSTSPGVELVALAAAGRRGAPARGAPRRCLAAGPRASHVAAGAAIDAEPPLDQGEVLVELAEERWRAGCRRRSARSRRWRCRRGAATPRAAPPSGGRHAVLTASARSGVMSRDQRAEQAVRPALDDRDRHDVCRSAAPAPSKCTGLQIGRAADELAGMAARPLEQHVDGPADASGVEGRAAGGRAAPAGACSRSVFTASATWLGQSAPACRGAGCI